MNIDIEKLLYTSGELSKVKNKYSMFEVFDASSRISEKIRQFMIYNDLCSIDSQYHKSIRLNNNGTLTVEFL